MNTVEWLKDIIERNKIENFTITEALKECKSTFDLICIVNYLLDDIIDLTSFETGTIEEQQNFNRLLKIKNMIFKIKNNIENENIIEYLKTNREWEE